MKCDTDNLMPEASTALRASYFKMCTFEIVLAVGIVSFCSPTESNNPASGMRCRGMLITFSPASSFCAFIFIFISLHQSRAHQLALVPEETLIHILLPHSHLCISGSNNKHLCSVSFV